MFYKYFPLVRRYVLKNSGTIDDAKDVFQNTLLAFYKNVSKLDFELTVQLNTYLVSIAKNIWLKELRKSSKIGSLRLENLDFVDEEVVDIQENETLILKMKVSLNNLSENCLKLVRLFHYQEKSWNEIVGIMGYKNEHAARNQKYKCLQKLRSMMNS